MRNNTSQRWTRFDHLKNAIEQLVIIGAALVLFIVVDRWMALWGR